MNPKIEDIKILINKFKRDLAVKERRWGSFDDASIDPQLIYSSNAHWKREEAYSWIYFDANVYRLKSSEQLKISIAESPLMKIYSLPAKKFWLEWTKLEREIYYRKDTISEPIEDESIWTYLQNLSDHVIKNGDQINWWRSLRSFLTFVRTSLTKEHQGLLEILFPREMELLEGKLIRKMKKQTHPIDIFSASKVIQVLINAFLEQKLEIRAKTILFTLGLVWMCLTTSRQRLPTELNLIYESKHSSLISRNEETKDPLFLFQAPTFFGGIDIPISCYCYEFLTILGRMSPSSKTLLPMTLRSLQRTFNDVVQNSLKMENLSLLTLLSHPREIVT